MSGVSHPGIPAAEAPEPSERPESPAAEPDTPSAGPEAPHAPAKQPEGRSGPPVKLLFVIGIIAVLLLVIGTVPRLFRTHKVNADAQQVRINVPTVSVVQPSRVTESGLTLPGNIEGSVQATVQARASGYINRIYVDIGSRVRKGELLAEISSPDLDQQVMQAQAQTSQSVAALGQSQASLAHSQQQLQVQRAAVVEQKAQVAQSTLNFNRTRQLWGSGLVAKQDAETALTALRTQRANVNSAEAAVRAAQADVASAQKGVHSAQSAVSAARANERRFVVLRGFENVTAPFDGVITARNVDPGALVNAGGTSTGTNSSPTGASGGTAAASTSGATSSTGLFQIANSDNVKIVVQVPETFAPGVQSGGHARVTVRELPGQVFQGTINLRSGAIDLQSRTLQVEIDIANREHLLLPGMFARVTLTPANPPSELRIPDSALISDAEGNRVALVGPNNRVHFQPVRTGRDFGQEIEIPGGLQDGVRLIDNPSATLQEGQEVRPIAAPPRDAGGAIGGPGGQGGGQGRRGGGGPSGAPAGGSGAGGPMGAPGGGQMRGPGGQTDGSGAGGGPNGGRGLAAGSDESGSQFVPNRSTGGAPAGAGPGGGATGGSRP